MNLEPGSGEEGHSEIYDELTEEEKKDFNSFLQKDAQNTLEIWEPWWLNRVQFTTTAIQEIDENAEIEYNMNRFG